MEEEREREGERDGVLAARKWCVELGLCGLHFIDTTSLPKRRHVT